MLQLNYVSGGNLIGSVHGRKDDQRLTLTTADLNRQQSSVTAGTFRFRLFDIAY